MKTTILAWLLSFIAMPLLLLGDEVAKVGGASVNVPLPAGFARFDGASKKLDELMANFVPATNRLLLVAAIPSDVASAKKDDTAELKRYMMLQTFRQGETMNLTAKDFAVIRDGVEKQFGTPGKRMDDLEKDVNANIKKAKLPVEMKIGETQMLGVFAKGDTSIDFGMLTKTQVGDGKAEPLAAAASITMVKGKVCYLYVYSNYKSQEDIDWARNTLKLWRLSIMEANP